MKVICFGPTTNVDGARSFLCPSNYQSHAETDSWIHSCHHCPAHVKQPWSRQVNRSRGTHGHRRVVISSSCSYNSLAVHVNITGKFIFYSRKHLVYVGSQAAQRELQHLWYRWVSWFLLITDVIRLAFILSAIVLTIS
ncbi:hypothetical protein KC19_9G186500 [Ceratodon purpureus]|uniref:Uncharacterized protein n=1 Tax=Ceratodon purpureus TaxID=3225 RepID=A0A8T0GWQ3_CERPU|nr:hypothetical protein KC19_9G186500 [Ceratodon purpureus]